MADVPKRVPWIDHVKKAGKLTIFIDGSIGRSGWAQVFKDATFEFNKLSTDHKLGVVLDIHADQKKANVEARAAAGDIEFSYPPDIPKETIPFDSSKPHGLTRAIMTRIVERGTVSSCGWSRRSFMFRPHRRETEMAGQARSAIRSSW